MSPVLVRVAASLAALTLVALGVYNAGVPSMAAVPEGTGVLTVTLEPVLINTNTPQTTAGNGLNTLGYNVSYSCSVAVCADATIQMSPGPKDPTYDTYRHVQYRNWTAPFIGATIGGNDATGKLITLGDLPAGASGSFPISYNWATSSASMMGAQFFPNGYGIVMTATGDSSSIASVSEATAAPVTWIASIREPGLGVGNPGTRDAGSDVAYSVTMHSGCLPLNAGYPRGDYRFTCAKSYEVVHTVDPRATFVSASHGGVWDAVARTITWTTEPAPGVSYPAPAPGWYQQGSSNSYAPRSVMVNYPPAAFSPSGTDDDFCGFTEQVATHTAMRMVFLGAGGLADDSSVRDLEAIRTHNVVCVTPFAKGVLTNKVSTYDGPSRIGTRSGLVVRPEGSPSTHRWDITVGNQSNVPGKAIISEPDLAIEGTRPHQIVATNSAGVQQNDASIAWTLNTGVTGISSGVANAPAGTWFTAATVTSGLLAGPNLLATGTATTVFMARIYYTVASDAPVGEQRTNTVTAVMTFPDNPSLPDLDLGSRAHTVQYVAPFGRGYVTKTTNSGTQTEVTIPASGASTGNYWRINVRNTGNIPGRPLIEDLDLDSTPMKVTSVTHTSTSGGSVGTSLTYTLNTGATETVSMPFTAPVGTWITKVSVIGSLLQPVNILESQGYTGANYEIRLGYAVPSTTVDQSSWTNTASATLTYPDMGVPDVVLPEQTATVTFVDPIVVDPVDPPPGDTRPRLSAAISSGVVEGGGSAVPGRDVVYTVRGGNFNIPAEGTFSPQYAFIAPADWMIVPGSASFPDGDVPSGVVFNYTTVVIGGVTRQVVIAEWPGGEEWGANQASMARMTVTAQPTATAAAGSVGVATAWMGESTNSWTTVEAYFRLAVTDTTDIDGDGVTTEGFSTVNAAGVRVGSASALSVVKEICLPDPSEADGCRWLSDPSTPVAVDPDATDIGYRLTVTNSGNMALSNLVGYDILPHLNDFGTSDGTASTPRGSTFQQTIGSVSDVSPGLTVTYSGSTQPPRPEVYSGATNGSWLAAADGAQALRLSYPGDLAPGQSVSMRYTAQVIGDPPNGAIACNSLAVRISGIGTVSEPAPVCAAVVEADLAVTLPPSVELQIGRPAVLELTATNVSGAASSSATVTVDIPAGLTVTSLSPEGWSCVATPAGPAPIVGAATLECSPAVELPRGEAVVLPLEVIPTAANLCLATSISGPSFDTDPTNNQDDRCFVSAAAVDGVAVTKTDGVTSARVGDTLSYSIQVSNELLFEELAGVSLTDTLPAGLTFVSATGGGTETGGVVSWDLGTLAADSSATVTVVVTVTDAVATEFTNRATVTVADPGFAGVTLTEEATDTNLLARIVLEKTGQAATTLPGIGDLVEYTFVVTNTGGATLSGVDIADSLSGLSAISYSAWPGALGVLEPGGSVTATASYPLTAANLDAGTVANTATVSGATADGVAVEASDSTDVALQQQPAIALDKSAATAGSAAGNLVTYTFVLTNTGNVTLTGVALSDPLVGLSDVTYGAWPTTAGVLGAGQSVTATASYPASQLDIDRGSLSNTATATGAFGGDPVSHSDSAIVSFVQSPQLTLEKTAALPLGSPGKAGDVITFTITVENTGNVTLSGVAITDELAGLSSLGLVWPGATGLLAPGEVLTATATYTVTQADADAGEVVNTADANARFGLTAVADGDTVTVVIPQNPEVTLAKSVDATGGTLGIAGDTLTFNFVVTNTGDVTLHGLSITDELAGLSALDYLWPGVPGELAPGQVATATASYTITQANVDAGFVANDASVSGLFDGVAVGDDDSVSINTPFDSSLMFTKNVEGSSIGPAQVGDAVSYTFSVTNTGVVTLHEVSITDGMAGLSALEYAWPGSVGVLAPGEFATATAHYALTQAEIDAGVLVNSATASAITSQDVLVTATDDATLPLSQAPAATLSKGAVVAFDGWWKARDIVTFTFKVVNTGTVTLTEAVITDPMVGLSELEYVWPGTEGLLAPGETLTATARYVLTGADIAAGSLTNTAELRALTGTQAEVTDEASVSLTAPPVPPRPDLVFTGVEVGGQGTLAAALLGGGMLLLVLAKRRRQCG